MHLFRTYICSYLSEAFHRRVLLSFSSARSFPDMRTGGDSVFAGIIAKGGGGGIGWSGNTATSVGGTNLEKPVLKSAHLLSSGFQTAEFLQIIHRLLYNSIESFH